MKRVCLLHAYSHLNAGDGLLVNEAITLITEAMVPQPVAITVVAVDPKSFQDLELDTVTSVPRSIKEFTAYARLLKSLSSYDLVVGVGGGYLRFGRFSESVKTLLVHVPQLAAAAYSGSPTVYLPQSIGPGPRAANRDILSRTVVHLLSRIDALFVRDDRSERYVSRAKPVRYPDMAITLLAKRNVWARYQPAAPAAEPVISVRAIDGHAPALLLALADKLPPYYVYLQSVVAGNDDREVSNVFKGDLGEISSADLMGSDTSQVRVVVAVRLHAALMALAAGHYVIHLGYERKGWGAFSDLGLEEYVHSVRDFSIDCVHAQVHSLLNDPEERLRYADSIQRSLGRLAGGAGDLAARMRSIEARERADL